MGEDFVVSPSTVLLFNRSNSIRNGDSVCIVVTLLDDHIYEETQKFVAQIRVLSNPSFATVGMLGSVTKTIKDNKGWFTYEGRVFNHVLDFRCYAWVCDG